MRKALREEMRAQDDLSAGRESRKRPLREGTLAQDNDYTREGSRVNGIGRQQRRPKLFAGRNALHVGGGEGETGGLLGRGNGSRGI